MKNKVIAFSIFFSTAFFQSAFAAPATRVEVKPSAIFIYANNQEDRAYTCSISYTWSHDDYGTRKSDTVNATAVVNPKFNGVIHSLTGSYVRVKLEGGASISCN